VKNIYRMHRC